jgi:hypothetical protein
MLEKRIYSKYVFYALIMTCFVSLTLLVFIDISFVKIAKIAHLPYGKGFLTPFFVVLSGCIVSFVITILYLIKKLVSENSRILDKLLLVSGKVSFIVYATIFTLLIILDYTIIIRNEYYYGLAVAITYISYFFGLAFCGLTIIQFLKWYHQDREFRILGYIITISALFALIVFSISYFSVNPSDLTLKIKPTGIGYAIVMRNSESNIFQTWFSISYILCIISVSVISFFVLRDYVRVNSVVYFALFSLPVLYALFKYIPPAMNIVVTVIMKDPIFYGTLYTLFFSGTGPLTGFLFFLPMWFFASKLRNPEIKRFIWLTSFGMLLFFTANQQPPLQNKLFPPFGLLSASITGLSVYLIFLGITSTAKYLSNVSAYRELISKKLREDKIFRSIARSSFEKQLQPIVSSMLEKNLFPVENRNEIPPNELSLYVSEVKKVLQEKDIRYDEEKRDNDKI